MSEDQETKPTPTGETGRERTERLRVVLEFVSRLFYPAILIVVLALLYPTLARIDLQALVDRLQSAKAGGYEFTFTQAQVVGAETAELNGKIAELERSLAALDERFQLLQASSAIAAALPPPPPPTDSRIAANAAYTVLVFHSRDGRGTAAAITDALLQAGFKSSRTETDFSELRRSHPPGTVLVTHNEQGAEALPQVQEILDGLALDAGTSVTIQERSVNLRRGEVQILVF